MLAMWARKGAADPPPCSPTFNVEYGTSNLFILKDLCRKGMTAMMKKADNICPYCGAKISYREKAKLIIDVGKDARFAAISSNFHKMVQSFFVAFLLVFCLFYLM